MWRVHVALEGETDWNGFRGAARRLLAQNVPPEYASWSTGNEVAVDIFGGESPLGALQVAEASVTAPAAFVKLCEQVQLHCDPLRFALMYRLLWRLRHEPTLRSDPLDVDRLRAESMAKAVRRDMHKMRAFVRFRSVDDGQKQPLHVAWFEPEHHIVEMNAPFFMHRFPNMRWAILTPQRCVRWNGEALQFGPGGQRSDAPPADAGEALWLTYYRHIFNPARLKLAMMQKEMPRKYWHNLPEADLIGPLVAQALSRTGRMIEAPATVPQRRIAPLAVTPRQADISATLPTDPHQALAQLRHATDRCRDCPLGERATQSVFGEGPVGAALMVVGEQPGEQEDLRGRPFVGPAGQLFDRAVAQLGWSRERLYLTNAVKHFKYDLRGQRRIHKTPAQREAAACLHWLESEIDQVQPQALLALGATAARALLGYPIEVMRERGRWHTGTRGLPVLVTLHPSALLRGDPSEYEQVYQQWLSDLFVASRYLHGDEQAKSP